MTTPPGSLDSPKWSGLFPKGSFEWTLRMRRSDPVEFFATTDTSSNLLKQKSELIAQHPERHLAISPEATPLLAGLQKQLEEWGLSFSSKVEDLPSLTSQIETDLLLMEPSSQTLVATSVCFPSSWEPTRWIGKPLTAIHDVVPRLNPRIGPMIDRFLRQLRPGKAYQRANWSLTLGDELNYHPALQRPPLDAETALDEVFLRLEHQIFTAIPGAILMGIRIEPVPLRSLSAYPTLWQQVLEKLETMPEDVARYKNLQRGLPTLIRQIRKLDKL